MPEQVTVSQRYQREAHRTMLLQALSRAGSASRAELSRLTGLRRSSVTTILQQFIDAGIVAEGESGPSTAAGGRRPVPLHICGSAGYIIGLDIGRNGYRAVLTTLDGLYAGDFTAGGLGELSLGKLIRRAALESREAFGLEPVLAFGVSISGTVDPLNGLVITSHVHGVSDYPLRPWLDDIDIPVLVENDANSLAWAEIVSPPGTGRVTGGLYIYPRLSRDEQGILQHVELGGSVIVNSEVWYGSRFISGEFALSSWFSGGDERAPFGPELLREIERDRGALRTFLLEVLRRLGTTCRLLDPDRVILGGIFAGERALAGDIISRELRRTWYDSPSHAERIVPAGADERTASAAYVLARLYRMPNIGSAAPEFDISWDYVLSSMQRSAR